MMASWPLCTVATVFIKRTCLTHGHLVPKIRGLRQQAIRRPNRWTSNPTGFGRSADVDGSHGLREFASVNGSDCSDGGSQDARGFFISTPIFYVNAEPHIGHLYSVALADCLHRQHSLCGLQGKLSTGTDEHGIKIQRAAKQMGRSPSDHCAAISAKFATLFQHANVAATDFVRTTEERHIQAVQHFWQTLLRGGHIYRGRYEGWYSSADEAFLTKDQVKQSGDHRNNIMVSIESGQPVDWIAEDNYMFRLSEFGLRLEAWLESSPPPIRPEKFRRFALTWVREGLNDLSISRDRSRLSWGVVVPNDPTQTIYVWLDALVNYLTVTGYPTSGYQKWWPCDLHVLGKDILKFHAIYWPAFLMAAGLELPRQLLVHSHWTVDGCKMSKSMGNSVNLEEELQRYTTDGMRYFLLRQGVPESDGDYYQSKITKLLHAELTGTLGGLLNRCVAKSLNPKQIFPPFDSTLFPKASTTSSFTRATDLLTSADYELITTVEALPALVQKHFENARVYRALEGIMACLHQANAFVQHKQPWKLPIMHSDAGRAREAVAWRDTVLHVALETLRVCGVLLQPTVPGLAQKLLARLGTSPNTPWKKLSCFDAYHGRPCPHAGQSLGPDTGLLFPRLDNVRSLHDSKKTKHFRRTEKEDSKS